MKKGKKTEENYIKKKLEKGLENTFFGFLGPARRNYAKYYGLTTID